MSFLLLLFVLLFMFLVSDRHALLACGFIPPHQALNMNGIRWGCSQWSPRTIYTKIANRDSGAFVRSANYLLIATDWTGSRTRRQGWGEQDGSEGHYQCFCPFSFFFSSLRDGGSGLLVWVNTQGWHGLQKPELEKGIRKEDLYIKAVRIVARDGGLGPAGEGGLK